MTSPSERPRILDKARAEAVLNSMTTFRALGGRIASMAVAWPTGCAGTALTIEEFPDGVIVLTWRDKALRPQRESYPDQATFADAYGLRARGAEQAEITEVQRKAVAHANAHLNNAVLPTVGSLMRALRASPSLVYGFGSQQRKDDFACGWTSAMGHVWNAMRGTLNTQRAIEDAEAQG